MHIFLKSYNQGLPGAYPYVQTQGISRTFPVMPRIEEQAQLVSAFRIANHLRRASLVECLEDVDAFQVARIKAHPDWCYQIDLNFEQAHQHHRFVNRSCSTCGTVVSA